MAQNPDDAGEIHNMPSVVEMPYEGEKLLENGHEELPRPETVTVCVDQEEFIEDCNSDILSVQDLIPLAVDPLSLEQQPILVKKEPYEEIKQSNPSGQFYVSDERHNVEYGSYCSILSVSSNVSNNNFSRKSVIVPIANGETNNAELKTSNIEDGSSVEEVNITQVIECTMVSGESQNIQNCSSLDVSKEKKQQNSKSETSNTNFIQYKVAAPKNNIEGKLVVVLKRSKVAERLLCETDGSFDNIKEDTDNIRSDNKKDTGNENSNLELFGKQDENETDKILTIVNQTVDSNMLAKKVEEIVSLSLKTVSQTSDVNTISGEMIVKEIKCIDCHKIFETALSLRGHRSGCRERKRKAVLVQESRKLPRRCSPGGMLLNRRSDGKPFQCKKCQRRFSSMIALRVHNTKIHKQSKDEVPKSTEHAELNINEEQNIFPCQSCDEIFLTSSALDVHKISHNEPVHKSGKFSLLSNSLGAEMYSKNSSLEYDFQKNVSSKRTMQKNKKVESMFNCNICNEVFKTFQDLNNHGIVHATQVLQPYLQNTSKLFRRGKSWGCPICPKRRCTKRALKNHMRLHLKFELFECLVCKKSFSDLNNLRRHEKIHSREQSYPCDVCEVICHNASHLKLHKRCHKQDCRFPCSICRKFFSSRQHLSKHECTMKQRLIHSNVEERIRSANSSETPIINNNKSSQEIITDPKYAFKGEWTCSVCGKIMSSKLALIRHTYLHTRKPYQCDICKKRFSTSFWLKNHISTYHRSERPYKCDSCDKTYCRSDSFKVHKESCMQNLANVKKLQELKLPSYEEKYKCKHCNALFSTIGYLKRHMNFYHGTISKFLSHSYDRIFRCAFCVKTCLTLNNMKQHVSTFHKFKAKNERKEFSETQFQNKKRYKCDYCNSTLSSQSALGAHVRHFHVLKKSFQIIKRDLTQSPNLNSIGKRYKCHPCNKTFINRSYLQSHINVVHRRRKDNTSPTKPKSSRKICRCEHCGVMCSDSNDLLNHIHLVHGNYENQVPKKKSLAHSVIYNSAEIHKCDKCDETFHDIHLLTRHMKSVHGKKLERNNVIVAKSAKKTYKCKVCGAVFIRKNELHKHNCYSNLQNKSNAPVSKSKLSSKFKTDCKKLCLVCGKSFILLDELKDHMLVHTTQESSYKCRVCHLTFPSSQSLAGHSKIHKGIEGYLSISSPPIKSLKLENKNKSDQEFQCKLCGKILSNKNALKRHNMIHAGEWPYSCQVCGSGFRERNKLANHMSRHEKSSYKNIHVNVPSYKCGVCNRSFLKMCNLARHLSVPH